MPRILILLAAMLAFATAPAQIPSDAPDAIRSHQRLDTDWRSLVDADPSALQPGFEEPDFDDSSWKRVSVPHNWDGYEGFAQAKHGDLHGRAWYRRTFAAPASERGRQIFLFFEGVGSYATVWVNGQLIGRHAGGLTTFTLDATQAIRFDQPNTLAVQVDHPAGIRDLPWVCGGCELAYGFSEGTQPFGIFRPVHVVATHPLRFDHFGIHIWNDRAISAERATLNIESEATDHRDADATEFDAEIRHQLLDAQGQIAAESRIAARSRARVAMKLERPQLWHPDHPYLYTLRSELLRDGEIIDRVDTPYGIRWVEWPEFDGPADQPLRINGQPFFLNGVADYEHQLGQSHAFTDTQVQARASKVQAAGFNTFRDAHHPHNLRFNQEWDRKGILWWTQFGAHIWFENDAFYANYKQLLRDWIRERRNSPSLILYGLQNESKLPAAFAADCAEIIRGMDPTASDQRPVTTCNGGEGTDWDVPQNWSGTYGGDLSNYANELRQQRMVGEYGAWRSIDLRSEGGFIEDGPLSEDRMAALMETKVRLAETVRGRAIGHFAWPLTTHQNPGRNVGSAGQQTADGIRELDQIGPANNKGLQTIWGEPLGVYYMYRSNYVPADTEPMVYIDAHTWPDRWTEAGTKSGIVVYSNCDDVELFNDIGSMSLGARKRGPRGTHFQWDEVPVRFGILYAEGRVNGEVVARDIVQFRHLPEPPAFAARAAAEPSVTVDSPGLSYRFRINCGGPSFTDTNGNTWQADRVYESGDLWGSESWAKRFPNLRPEFGSKRRIYDPIDNAADDLLFQSFRYGRDELAYRFAVPDGLYTIELYFIEPWYGIGGGLDAAGWRVFDVAVNGEIKVSQLDIWSEAGPARVVKRSIDASARDGELRIHFPNASAGQAVISAIAIATADPAPAPVKKVLEDSARPTRTIANLAASSGTAEALTWLDAGDRLYVERSSPRIAELSYELRESEWIRLPAASAAEPSFRLQFDLAHDADLFVAVEHDAEKPSWLDEFEPTPFALRAGSTEPGVMDIWRQRRFAGDRAALGPVNAGSGYAVIVKRRYPPAPAKSVADFVVRGSHQPELWQPVANLRSGRALFSDGGATLAGFHARLSDCDWLRGPQSDAANPDLQVSFRVLDHTEVYVAFDERVEAPPPWAKDWLRTDFYVQPTGMQRRPMLKRRFAPGSSVTLGSNGTLPDGGTADLYSVVMRVVREAFTYPIIEHKPDQGVAEWKIYVGVGDRYGLNVPFERQGGAASAVAGKLEIVAADGSLVCDSAFELPAEQSGVIRLRTCDSINAGDYTIRFSFPPEARLRFGNIEVE